MRITVNDMATDLPEGSTVADALSAKDIHAEGIALALNGKVLPKSAYGDTVLNDGDSIIIIKAFYGG